MNAAYSGLLATAAEAAEMEAWQKLPSQPIVRSTIQRRR